MRSSRRKATTIIEVVMAVLILSFGMPALLSAFTEASMQAIRPANEAVASFLATERMEEIVARRYQGTDGYTSVNTTNFPVESSVTNFPRFARSVTVTYTNSSLATVGSDQGYKKVRVAVTWSSGAKSLVIERVFSTF